MSYVIRYIHIKDNLFARFVILPIVTVAVPAVDDVSDDVIHSGVLRRISDCLSALACRKMISPLLFKNAIFGQSILSKIAVASRRQILREKMHRIRL